MARSFDEYPTSESYGPDSYPGGTSALLGEDGISKIIIMGPRRTGKSSIQKVVFEKMSAHETLFLDATPEPRIKDVNTNSLVRFKVLDFPGNFMFDKEKAKTQLDDPQVVFAGAGALVFVIDGQDEGSQQDAVDYFVQLANIAHKVNPHLNFDVLIHKVDGESYVSDEHKMECQRNIFELVSDELADARINVHPTFYMTSIYDHTIFEAFSKIVQRLVSELPFLEALLDSLITRCHIEKAFLFDVVSKIYVATDSNPVDMQTYELCSDMIDVVIDISCIYGLDKEDSKEPTFDSSTGSVIKLSNNYILYLREVNRYLALVCLMRHESFTKSGLLEYNFQEFRKAIDKCFLEKNKKNRRDKATV